MFEMNRFKSIDELVKFFPTEQSCIDFLERQRWGDHYQIYGRDIQDVMGGVTGGAGVYG